MAGLLAGVLICWGFRSWGFLIRFLHQWSPLKGFRAAISQHHPNVPVLRALMFPLNHTWGLLKGSWGVLEVGLELV